MEEERRGELGRRAGESGWEPANVLSRLSARRGRFPLTPAGLRGKDQKRVAFGTFFFNCCDQIVHKKQMKGQPAVCPPLLIAGRCGYVVCEGLSAVCMQLSS